MRKFVLVFGLLILPAGVQAAQLRICFDNSSLNADVKKIQFLANNAVVFPDILAGTTVSGSRRCGDFPFPSALIRGQDYSLTLKAENALEEVGPASNALPFHSPATPGAISGFSLSIIVP